MDTTAHFERNSFAYPIGDYLQSLPQEMRICGLQDYLEELWNKCKEKQQSNSEYIKLFIGKNLYNNRRIFDQYISGLRNPTLQFINLFFEYCKSLGIMVDYKNLQKLKFLIQMGIMV